MIRFTTDGSPPDEQAAIYQGPIEVDRSMTVIARAFKEQWAPSDMHRADYEITGTVGLPVFSLEPGLYTSPQTLELTTETPEAEIRYTTDGTEPNQDAMLYEAPLDIDQTMAVIARAFKDRWEPSDLVTAEYEITGTVATPEFSLEPGLYTSPQALRISSDTPDAAIHFTVDGSEPTRDARLYEAPMEVSHTMTVRARAFKDDWETSDIRSVDYEVTGTVARPQFSLAQGLYTSPQVLQITTETPDAEIRFTIDGQ